MTTLNGVISIEVNSILSMRLHSFNIKDKTIESYLSAIDKVFRKYNRVGVTLQYTHCDREFIPLMELIKDHLGIALNPTNTQDYSTEIERSIKIVKSHIRVVCHQLKYKTLPKLVFMHLAFDKTKKLNMFPSKVGVLQYYSPHAMIDKKTLD